MYCENTRRREKGPERICEEILSENDNLMRDMNINI